MSDFKGDKIIDSRDIIARIEELQEELDDLLETETDELADGTVSAHETAANAVSEWKADNAEELAELLALAEQGEGYGEWSHGETLILESHFEEYAQELAEDTGAVNKDATWPNNHIDWESAANELKVDYTEVDFGGTTYLMRSY